MLSLDNRLEVQGLGFNKGRAELQQGCVHCLHLKQDPAQAQRSAELAPSLPAQSAASQPLRESLVQVLQLATFPNSCHVAIIPLPDHDFPDSACRVASAHQVGLGGRRSQGHPSQAHQLHRHIHASLSEQPLEVLRQVLVGEAVGNALIGP